MTKLKKKPNPHRGSSLDELLAADGVLEQFQAAAIKNVIAWQIARAMEAQNLSKTDMATRMKTSRAQLDRLLDPDNGNVTLETLSRAAAILGRQVKVELV
jgi:antitoxin HicB